MSGRQLKYRNTFPPTTTTCVCTLEASRSARHPHCRVQRWLHLPDRAVCVEAVIWLLCIPLAPALPVYMKTPKDVNDINVYLKHGLRVWSLLKVEFVNIRSTRVTGKQVGLHVGNKFMVMTQRKLCHHFPLEQQPHIFHFCNTCCIIQALNDLVLGGRDDSLIISNYQMKM